MEDDTQQPIILPEVEEYVSIKDAAKMLGVSNTSVQKYVSEGRIKAKRVANVIMIPVEEVKRFRPNATGRPRTMLPPWRIAPRDNILFRTTIVVQLRSGKQAEFKQRLEEIRRKKEHSFPGTVARYIVKSRKQPEHIKISLIWRSTVAPDEAARQQALEAFKARLADVLDWETASYDEGNVMMHA
ncbi:helix-turn-helix domain-containing protein [Ktedonosporobacter rubrisoli]|uniref:Helix-turn-helix domain-containing protein n=1 Tax=Ktedonosporobacter rubrisoli TaxID=2509675 RepID=A0A4P6JS55_KTERU|nr:helix-turn-helix domain-containing protein [Ktedonosporobacter rubrisoli]QBD78153.1 helix-turn-helix domain-containing protein [Ktedonosporobacter rubrisoli]